MQSTQQILKYLIGLLIVIGLRLAPHPPNVEPIMATMMPFSKKWGWISGMVFCLLAVLSYDILTGTLGIWTTVTAVTYALLGIASGLYFKNKDNNIRHYVGFAIVATLVYDAITGIGMGMVFFDQTFMSTFTGQIPFTASHLAGNIVLSGIVSPLLYTWVVSNAKLETGYILHKLALQ